MVKLFKNLRLSRFSEKKYPLILVGITWLYLALVTLIPVSDGDTFLHLALGKYIYYHGLLSKDPFSMHTLDYYTHEWLSEYIFYIIYKFGGYLGLYLFKFFFIVLVLGVCYKINCFLSKGSKLSFYYTLIQYSSISVSYFVLRPQMFSALIFALEIYVLEMFIRGRSKKIIYLLPLFVVLLVNFHAGTYPFFFVIITPYLADLLFKIRIGRVRSERYSTNPQSLVKPLLFSTAVSLFSGLLNPYGLKVLKYFTLLFTSTHTQNIGEWQTSNFKAADGIGIFLFIFIPAVILICSRKPINLRSVLFLVGMNYMVLTAVRYFLLYLIIVGFVIVEHIDGLKPISPSNLFKKVHKFYTAKTALILILMLYCSAFYFSFLHERKITDFSRFPVKSVEYIKNNLDYKNIRIFNEYNYGSYMMFHGIRVFVDSRADLYVREYNKGCTVLSDFMNLTYGKVYHMDIFNKYKLDYCLIYKNHVLDSFLKRDKRFVEIFSDEISVLYKINR
ncbi:MAG: hypothetical protein N2645_01365 [Clostridia bacterium]|nr:hypothetical protein [Clostridia bacterium]